VWYRWFESGRDVRVSEQFLERLSAALRLSAHDQVTLYRLAIPSLYRADCAREVEGEALAETGASPASPILSDAETEIAAAADTFANERELFLTRGRIESRRTRARIVRSWQRSQALGIDADRSEVSFAAGRDVELRERRETSERLLRAGAGVVKHLSDRLSRTGYAIVLTDRSGCLLDIEGDLDVRRRLSRLHFEPGGDWSEASAGTNAIGTALADGRPLQLMGAEHFCNGWGAFTCTAAPIRAPGSGEVLGVLDITGDYRLVRRHLVGTVLACALEIEERLVDLV
jgi:two-component system sensor histidine kinase KdpD